MSTTQQINTKNLAQSNNTTQTIPQKTSALQRVSLGFEYDKTLQEIKREVRARTI